MRRLEEVLHDLAEQDERLPTSDLITRIERHLSGESDLPVVVIDGRLEMDAHKNTRQAQRRRWAPALVAAGAALLVLLVVGLPILFFNGDESIVADQSTTTVASTTVPPTTAAPTTVPATTVAPAVVVPFPSSDLAVLEAPLSEAVPGFIDTIVMWTLPMEGVDIMRWRPSEPTTELLLSLDSTDIGPVGLDASGNWFVGDRADGTEGTLSIHSVPTVPGKTLDPMPIGLGVDSVAWHNTAPGQLVWLESPEGRDGAAILLTLDVTDQAAEPVPIQSFEQGFVGNPFFDGWDGPGVWLESWGSGGVLIRSFEEDSEGNGPESLESVELVLVDVDGTETSMGSGIWWMADGPDGTLIWRGEWEEPCFVMSPDGQYRSAVPGVADDEFLYDAWWSPDGTRIALWLDKNGGYVPEELVMRTVDSASGAIITEIADTKLDDPWGNALTWSTDSRFLVYQSEPSTLVIHDTATNATTMIPLAETIAEIRVQ